MKSHAPLSETAASLRAKSLEFGGSDWSTTITTTTTTTTKHTYHNNHKHKHNNHCNSNSADSWPYGVGIPRSTGNSGWHYLSNATCLTRPRLFYACFVVSGIAKTCYIFRHFRRTPALDNKCYTSGSPWQCPRNLDSEILSSWVLSMLTLLAMIIQYDVI